MSDEDPPIQGYLFHSESMHGEAPTTPLGSRQDTVCHIVRRAEMKDGASEHMILDLGPAFVVRFGDDVEEVAYAQELSPWYPTD